MMESMEHKTSDQELLDLIFRTSCGASVSKNKRMITMEDDKGNNPTILDSSRSRDEIPTGWRVLGKDEDRLASDAYWSQSCKDWLLIGDDRVKYANELDKWHAIRQVVVTDFFLRKGVAADFFLLEGYDYSMPGGQTIRVTAKGFEVL